MKCILTYHFVFSTEGSLRLQDGSRSYGRLEVYHNNQWGTVCDEAFNQPDADVACNQLGFVRAHCWGKVEQFGCVCVHDVAISLHFTHIQHAPMYNMCNCIIYMCG